MGAERKLHLRTNMSLLLACIRLPSGMPAAAFMPPGCLLAQPLLEELDLSRIGLSSFPADALSLGRTLRVLRLAGNKIAAIPDGIGTACVGKLEDLDFSNNELSSLTRSGFGAWPLRCHVASVLNTMMGSRGKIGFRLLSTKVNPSTAISVHISYMIYRYCGGIVGLKPRIWRFQTVVEELLGHGVPRQLEIK